MRSCIICLGQCLNRRIEASQCKLDFARCSEGCGISSRLILRMVQLRRGQINDSSSNGHHNGHHENCNDERLASLRPPS
jgi:hypothetical protein